MQSSAHLTARRIRRAAQRHTVPLLPQYRLRGDQTAPFLPRTAIVYLLPVVGTCNCS